MTDHVRSCALCMFAFGAMLPWQALQSNFAKRHYVTETILENHHHAFALRRLTDCRAVKLKKPRAARGRSAHARWTIGSPQHVRARNDRTCVP